MGRSRAWRRGYFCATGNGGALRDRRLQAPNPFVAGPVDISVLVLDSASGEPVPDAKVSVKVEPWAGPVTAVLHPATTRPRPTSCFYAAVFELRSRAPWAVDVDIKGQGRRPGSVSHWRPPKAPTLVGIVAVGLLAGPDDLALWASSIHGLAENRFSNGNNTNVLARN